MITSSVPIMPASLAMPLPTPLVRVGRVVGVSFRTVGPTRLDGSEVHPTSSVLPRSHRLQVVRANASPVPTEMVELDTTGQLTVELLVKPPMHVYETARAISEAPDPHSPVAISFHALPSPTAFSELDIGKQSREWVGRWFAAPHGVLQSEPMSNYTPDDAAEAWTTLTGLPITSAPFRSGMWGQA